MRSNFFLLAWNLDRFLDVLNLNLNKQQNKTLQRGLPSPELEGTCRRPLGRLVGPRKQRHQLPRGMQPRLRWPDRQRRHCKCFQFLRPPRRVRPRLLAVPARRGRAVRRDDLLGAESGVRIRRFRRSHCPWVHWRQIPLRVSFFLFCRFLVISNLLSPIDLYRSLSLSSSPSCLRI